jgi:hypothetical protein
MAKRTVGKHENLTKKQKEMTVWNEFLFNSVMCCKEVGITFIRTRRGKCPNCEE